MTSTEDLSFAVLVVEDNPLLLMDAMDMAEAAGFRVYGAGNADQAMRMMNDHADICVLFTDIDMPGSMDGLQLAHLVRDGWPPVGIIVSSGYRKVAEGDLPEDGLFFSKPYSPEAISNALTGMAKRFPQ